MAFFQISSLWPQSSLVFILAYCHMKAIELNSIEAMYPRIVNIHGLENGRPHTTHAFVSHQNRILCAYRCMPCRVFCKPSGTWLF